MKEEIKERIERIISFFKIVEAFLNETIINPRDTRKLICDFTNKLQNIEKRNLY
jgi:hypothetical protein